MLDVSAIKQKAQEVFDVRGPVRESSSPELTKEAEEEMTTTRTRKKTKKKARTSKKAKKKAKKKTSSRGKKTKEETQGSPRRERPKMKGEGRVYKYGAWAPRSNLDLVFDQFRKAHLYRNKLCELERKRRDHVDAVLAELCPELVAVEEEIGTPSREADPESGTPAMDATGLLAKIETIEQEIRARRSRDRSRKAKKEEQARIRPVRDRLRELRKRRKELRKELFSSDEWRAREEAIEADHKAEYKAARAASGLYWGTYLQVEQAAQSMRKGAPPRFRPWFLRRDKLAVQFQGGLSVQELLQGKKTKNGDYKKDNRLQLTLSRRPRALPGSRRGEIKLNGALRLRIGSDGRDPVWAEVPIRYHRPLPEDARIKWVYLIRRDLGLRSVWSVQFVLERASWKKKGLATSGMVGIDVGWRLLPNGKLRVAVWSGSDGKEGAIALPAWWLSETEKVERILSERDRLRDAVRPMLTEWAEEEDKPWVRQTRSQRRLLKWLKRERDGDREIPEEIEEWRKREIHLLEYESHLRDQLQGSRLDLYRRAAAMLSRMYATAVIEDMDLTDFQKHKKVEEGATREDDAKRQHQRDACISKLIGALKGRMSAVVRVDPSHTTSTCHACGHVDVAWEDRSSVLHKCPGCDLLWDQDVNAARNLLKSQLESAAWERRPLPPKSVLSYQDGKKNRAMRRAARRRAQLSKAGQEA